MARKFIAEAKLPNDSGLISKIMNFFIRRFYITTFSVVFGLFLSIIPKVLTDVCTINNIGELMIAAALVVFGFVFSFYFGDIKENNKKLKNFFRKV